MSGIKDVWRYNLEDEFQEIRQIVQKFNYVSMDTEFPGVVARPNGTFASPSDYLYQLLRCNVDLLKIIQLGLTFLDENGKTPKGQCVCFLLFCQPFSLFRSFSIDRNRE